MVLSSLSRDFTACSWALLCESGHFEEIGKRGVWSRGRAAGAVPHARFHAIALDSLAEREAPRARLTLLVLRSRATARVAVGLPRVSFWLEQAVAAAFRWLQSGRSIGKVVVRLRAPPSTPAAQASHLLSGGTGALGQATAGWLTQRGATRCFEW